MNVLKRKSTLFIAIFVMVTSVSAQNIKFELNNFPSRENDLKNALSLIDQGEKFLFEAETMLSGKGMDIRYKANAINMISKGLAYFLQANAFNPQSAQLNYTIGKSYLYMGDCLQALDFLRKALLLDEKGFEDIHFLIGQGYQQMGELELAIESYNIAARNYGNEENWSNIISSKIKECKYTQELMNNAANVHVESMDATMNTESMEYFPIITEGDELLLFERFSSGKNKIYVAERTPKGWKAAEETNQLFLFSEKDKEILKELTLVDKNGIPAVTRWFTINVGSQQQIKPDYYESVAASVKSKNKTIAYFPSNRHEGAGGFDIFMSQSSKKGRWKRPRNISEINTGGDECSVVLHPAGHTLYFSSNGHQTMGGYDIFKSEYDGKHWSKPENLGYPVNSAGDDIVYSISEDGNRLYFSSNRANGKGGYDVYMVNFTPDVRPARRTQYTPMNVSTDAIGVISAREPLIRSEAHTAPMVAPAVAAKYPATVNGFISDNRTYKPLGNVTLHLLDKSNNVEEVIKTNSKGSFHTILSAGGSYRIVIDIPGYQAYVEDFKMGEEIGQKLSKNILLTSLAGKNKDVPAEAETWPEQPGTVAPESEESYEDIVVLAPVVTNAQPPLRVAMEYPVTISGLVTDNVTFTPIQGARVKVMLKNSDDEQSFETNAKGLVNFYLASGNTYLMTVSAKNYEDYVEELVLARGRKQKLSKTFRLRAAGLVPEKNRNSIK
jgi:tetratricopeptide (TPR) repeat protein